MFLKSIIDTILSPAITFLQFALDKLNSVSLVAARGLNLDYYLSPVALMGSNWVVLIKSLIASIILLTVVFVAKNGFNIYLQAKEGVRWW